MHVQYHLYTSAREALKNSGLEARIAAHTPTTPARIDRDQALARKEHAESNGHHEARVVPENYELWKRRTNALFSGLEDARWRIHTNDGIKTPRADYTDLAMLHGSLATDILSPQEFWQHEEHGFDNHAAYVSAVYIRAQEHAQNTQDWTHDSYHARISTDENGNTSISRTDTTEHPVFDPLGNLVPLKPVANNRADLAPGQELVLLSTLLTHAHNHQTRFSNPQYVNDYLASTQRHNTDQHGQISLADAFTNFNNPVPHADRYESTHQLRSTDGPAYSAFEKTDGSLVLRQSRKANQLVITRDETDACINSLIEHTKRPEVKTPHYEMLVGLRYQFCH